MSTANGTSWKTKQTEETREVERLLRPHFQQVDAYRFNIASIRVRVIDDQFEGKSAEERAAKVEPLLEKLPESIQADIVNLLMLAPEEIKDPHVSFRHYFMNAEFEDPRPSLL